VAEHALLPGLALLITTIGTWTLTMRNNMVTTLAEDYVRMARAKGLRPHRIMLNYAARNAILPNLTGFAMSLGFVVGGAILIEYVFNYPGVGYMLLQAVENEDYPLNAGTLPADHGGGGLGSDPARRHRDRDLRPADQEQPVRGRLWRALARSPKATAGAILLAAFIVLALFPGLFRQGQPVGRGLRAQPRAERGAPVRYHRARPGHLRPGGLRHQAGCLRSRSPPAWRLR